MEAVALQQVFDDPSPGRDLDETGELLALESLTQEPEEPSVSGVAMVDERDWREIAKRCDALIKESKDLRVAVTRSRAQLKTKGLASFCDTLAFNARLVGEFWKDVYPRLDEDDDDPTVRLNVIRELCNGHMLAEVRNAQIASVRGIGSYALQDILVTKGLAKARTGTEAPATQHVAQVLREGCPPELRPQVVAGIESLNKIESEIRGQVGNAYPCDLAPVRTLLTQIRDAIDEHAPQSAEVETTAAASANGNSVPAARASADIAGRDDVVKALERILTYYERYEPSSPVPLLLERAKRLVPMSFVEIIKDLADTGLPQIEVISGQKLADEE